MYHTCLYTQVYYSYMNVYVYSYWTRYVRCDMAIAVPILRAHEGPLFCITAMLHIEFVESGRIGSMASLQLASEELLMTCKEHAQ